MATKIKKNDWRRKLHNGDEVTWNDPDEGLCTKTVVIGQIEFLDDDMFRMTTKGGDSLEGYLHELS